jgi:hypothetical protein
MAVNASWSAAVVPLPCMLRTSGTLLAFEYPVGMWTITIRFRPATDTVRVVDPGLVEVPHPVPPWRLVPAVAEPECPPHALRTAAATAVVTSVVSLFMTAESRSSAC